MKVVSLFLYINEYVSVYMSVPIPKTDTEEVKREKISLPNLTETLANIKLVFVHLIYKRTYKTKQGSNQYSII